MNKLKLQKTYILFGVSIDQSILKVAILISPLIIIIFFIAAKMIDVQIYYMVLAENHIFESSTVVLYAIASVLTFSTAYSLIKTDKLWHGYLSILFGIIFFFIMGEEASWGQRFFNIKSPDFFLLHNSQQEINIHNLKPIHQVLHDIYKLVGLLGASMWVVIKLKGEQAKIFYQWFIPNWYLCFYFLPVFIFYCYHDHIHPYYNLFEILSDDQEPGEFILSIGFVLYALENWLRVRGIQFSKK